MLYTTLVVFLPALAMARPTLVLRQDGMKCSTTPVCCNQLISATDRINQDQTQDQTSDVTKSAQTNAFASALQQLQNEQKVSPNSQICPEGGVSSTVKGACETGPVLCCQQNSFGGLNLNICLPISVDVGGVLNNAEVLNNNQPNVGLVNFVKGGPEDNRSVDFKNTQDQATGAADGAAGQAQQASGVDASGLKNKLTSTDITNIGGKKPEIPGGFHTN